MIRFYNARILTMESGKEMFLGELWTNEDRIVYVGASKKASEIWKEIEISEEVFEREIDCNGNVLMPGFKNAHAHSGMTVLRTMADDMALGDWLTQQIFPREAKLTPDMIHDATMLANLEYLTSGITANIDMYLAPEASAEACIKTGMRCVLTGNLNNFSSSIEYMDEMYQKLNQKDPLISYMLGFHAEYTTSYELMEQVGQLAAKYQAPVTVHMSETKAEVDGCLERYGKTPMKVMDELGIFRYGGAGYHCIYLTEEDMDLFLKNKMTVVSNAGSNTKLASGIAPIARFLERKIPVAIGTDGPSSNNCLDMFREMFLITGLAKLSTMDPSAVDAMEVLKMATVNGAYCMGLPDADILAAGKLADLIMIDLQQPNMQPLNNICKNIVYSGSKQNVKLTMIGGKILYENGSFSSSIDVEKIYSRANEIADFIR